MKNSFFVFAILRITQVATILTLTGILSQSTSAQNLPTNLRVDIADGNTGQLLITWTQPSGGTAATYFTLQRSTSSGSGYSTVANCSGTANLVNTATPFNEGGGAINVCHDNNSGAGLAPGTVYFYRVEACSGNTPPCPNGYTTSAASNTPVTCNCTQGSTTSQIPPMIWHDTSGGKNSWESLVPPKPTRVAANVVDKQVVYGPTATELYAASNPGVAGLYPIASQEKLLVELPGSGSSCSYSAMMYTAQNLGFDTICVNYSNKSKQETICAGNPGCFYYVTEAKFDASGPCGVPNTNSTDCGEDPYPGPSPAPYSNGQHDAVYSRILTMLEYLTGNTGTNPCNVSSSPWGQYLLAQHQTETGSYCALNWSQIILGGWSQGGDMATYAAGLEASNGTPLVRAINWSAPPQATVANNRMTAATYLKGWFPGTSIRSVFGLVSANDDHYQTLQGANALSVYQAVWNTMGFTPGSPAYDGQADLNCTTATNSLCNVPISAGVQGLSCTGTPVPSNNIVNFAAVNPYSNPPDGHPDTIYIWNQDIYEYMLLDN